MFDKHDVRDINLRTHAARDINVRTRDVRTMMLGNITKPVVQRALSSGFPARCLKRRSTTIGGIRRTPACSSGPFGATLVCTTMIAPVGTTYSNGLRALTVAALFEATQVNQHGTLSLTLPLWCALSADCIVLLA